MTKIPRLFELMDERGIKAVKLSADTKISTGNISDWKSGRCLPTVEKLNILADYFDVSTDYLLGKSNIRKPNVVVRDEDNNLIMLDDDALQLIDSLRSRPEMKMLFSVSQKATTEDIIQAVKIIEALKKDSE